MFGSSELNSNHFLDGVTNGSMTTSLSRAAGYSGNSESGLLPRSTGGAARYARESALRQLPTLQAAPYAGGSSSWAHGGTAAASTPQQSIAAAAAERVHQAATNSGHNGAYGSAGAGAGAGAGAHRTSTTATATTVTPSSSSSSSTTTTPAAAAPASQPPRFDKATRARLVESTSATDVSFSECCLGDAGVVTLVRLLRSNPNIAKYRACSFQPRGAAAAVFILTDPWLTPGSTA